jgi:hypothetical protein
MLVAIARPKVPSLALQVPSIRRAEQGMSGEFPRRNHATLLTTQPMLSNIGKNW